ncbi:hypothetical protein [Streptomyces sp. GC420]|uniref:hypothetical protein n=1 Tax=Streptomyces sp. GC420 TaxID=2697568 RepID=UPI0014152EAF|nr:hypothetical protein [Streptomyces sp. GC420]NBM18195.1 hypothetical protein [Streptomyces sp. GC420]
MKSLNSAVVALSAFSALALGALGAAVVPHAPVGTVAVEGSATDTTNEDSGWGGRIPGDAVTDPAAPSVTVATDIDVTGV